LQELADNQVFRDAASFREQYQLAKTHIAKLSERKGKQWIRTINSIDLGIFFGVNSSSVIKQIDKPLEPRELGRPHVISDAIKRWIAEIIQIRFQEHRPISYRELEVELADQFGEH
jgi:hypothetical protein